MRLAMLLVAVSTICVLRAHAAFSQNGPSEAISARCARDHFQDSDRKTCEAAQRKAMVDFVPIWKFIADGEYIVQSLVLSACIDASKDYYGTDYARLANCYDDAISRDCEGRKICLANGSIAGIAKHIKDGTKP